MRRKRENIMLAYPASTRKIQNLGRQFFIQPKYRGQRMRVEWFHNEPVLLSSYGVEFRYFPHIKEELKKLPHLPYDGEAYLHGWSQEQINSVANRTVNKHPDSEVLQFHIFDYQGIVSDQFHRTQRLLKIQKSNFVLGDIGDIIQLVPTRIASPDTWQTHLQEWMEEGYEGIIFRNPSSLYIKKKCSAMIKFKPTSKDKYKIVAVYEAIDKYGEPKSMVGGFTVKDNDNAEFNVGAGKLPHSKRIEYWKDREDLIEKMLLVKHEDEKTRHGVPVCAVAVEVVK